MSGSKGLQDCLLPCGHSGIQADRGPAIFNTWLPMLPRAHVHFSLSRWKKEIVYGKCYKPYLQVEFITLADI